MTPTVRFVPGHCGNPQCQKPMAQRVDRPPALCPDCEIASEQPTGMKFDDEKPRFDLLLHGMPRALEEVTKVLTFGSRKYADGNWQYVENPQTRYLAAGTRHEIALALGETHDPESRLHPLAHKLCCDLFRLELLLREEKPND